MGSSFGRDIGSAFKQPSTFGTPGIGDGIPGNRPIGGSPAFQSAFGDMITENQDSGLGNSTAPKPGGLFGSGVGGEEFVNMLTRAAALAQGDYGTAAQIGELIGKPARDQRKRDETFEDWKRQQQWSLDNKPVNNDTVNDFNWYSKLTPEQRKIYREMKPLYRMGKDGQFYAMDPNDGADDVPTAPVGRLTPISNGTGGAAVPPRLPLGAKVGYDGFKGAIIGQETGGRYGIRNTEGSGAMGVGQQMPDTARTLAGRLGLPWRPDLMTSSHPEAQQYQNAITDAAVKEAWDAGGQGQDPATSAKYYFGGSNRGRWGPKTNRYSNDILTRLGIR